MATAGGPAWGTTGAIREGEGCRPMRSRIAKGWVTVGVLQRLRGKTKGMEHRTPVATGDNGDRLAGQTALVTGAGRGLGRAIAMNLASEAAAVVVIARSTAEVNETVALIQRSGGQAMGVAMDVTESHRVWWRLPPSSSCSLTASS